MQAALCIGFLFFAAPQLSAAQEAAASAPTRVDSLRAEYDTLQTDFRQRFLDATSRGGSAVPCQYSLGYLCVDDHVWSLWIPNIEYFKLDSVRLLLADKAGELIRLGAGDAQLNGHRIRFLVDASEYERVAAALAECNAEGWWCSALAGFAATTEGNYAAGDSIFQSVLQQMPDSTACRWRDITDLLDRESLDIYVPLACDARIPLENTFWWRSDPLLATVANERRAEHFARRVRNDILHDSPFPAPSFPYDRWLRLATTKFGYGDHWTLSDRHVHMLPSSVQFSPIHSPFSEDVDPWDEPWLLHQWNNDTRERMSLVGLELHQLLNQRAVFQRRDSTYVVVAADLSRDTLLWEPAEANLVLASGQSAPRTTRTQRQAGKSFVIGAMSAVRGPHIAAVELKGCHGYTGWARGAVRNVFDSDGRLALSDPLLFTPSQDRLPRGLDAALLRMLPTTRIVREDNVGIFWEVYGATPDDSLTVTIEAAPFEERRGLFTRLAGALGLAGERSPTSVQWTEPTPGGGGIRSGAIALSLADLPTDRYTLRLTVLSSRGDSATVSRMFELIDRKDVDDFMPREFSSEPVNNSRLVTVFNILPPVERDPVRCDSTPPRKPQ